MFKYNGFLSYNGYINVLKILPVFDIFEDEIVGVRIIIEAESGGRPNEDMKMSSAPCFGAPEGDISDVVAQVL